MRSNGLTKCGIVLFLTLGFGTLATEGEDELPKSKLAQGKAETVLAGIDLFKTPLKQALAKLGKPTTVEETPESPGIAGSRSYSWATPKFTVRIKTDFWHKPQPNDKLTEDIGMVSVEGADGAFGQTGRGLKLGDPYTEVARIYGNRFVKSHDGAGDLIEVEWKSGTSLVVYWNDKGSINHIELFSPE